MDENEYRQFLESIHANKCWFDKAILTRRFSCTRSFKTNIGEREAVVCKNNADAELCRRFLDQVYANVNFTLGQTGNVSRLTHAKEIKVQCGSINGLVNICADLNIKINSIDITNLVSIAFKQYPQLQELPYSPLLRCIAEWKTRKRTKKIVE